MAESVGSRNQGLGALGSGKTAAGVSKVFPRVQRTQY